MNRRKFLLLAAGSTLVSGKTLSLSTAQTAQQPKFKAIAFDAFPIFDSRPVADIAESLFPGKGPEIMNIWRARQFEYQWLRALSGQYVDFLQITQESLIFASRQLHLDIPPDKFHKMMSAYSNLKIWPEVPAALNALHKAGIRLVFLSNMTHSMLENGIKQAGLTGVFENILSTDQIKSYKPDPRAYQMAVDHLKLKQEDILFVAFAGWDVAGAKWFGYPTFWVNRLGNPMEELGTSPDGSGRDLDELVKFVMPDYHSSRKANAAQLSVPADSALLHR